MDALATAIWLIAMADTMMAWGAVLVVAVLALIITILYLRWRTSDEDEELPEER